MTVGALVVNLVSAGRRDLDRRTVGPVSPSDPSRRWTRSTCRGCTVLPSSPPGTPPRNRRRTARPRSTGWTTDPRRGCSYHAVGGRRVVGVQDNGVRHERHHVGGQPSGGGQYLRETKTHSSPLSFSASLAKVCGVKSPGVETPTSRVLRHVAIAGVDRRRPEPAAVGRPRDRHIGTPTRPRSRLRSCRAGRAPFASPTYASDGAPSRTSTRRRHAPYAVEGAERALGCKVPKSGPSFPGIADQSLFGEVLAPVLVVVWTLKVGSFPQPASDAAGFSKVRERIAVDCREVRIWGIVHNRDVGVRVGEIHDLRPTRRRRGLTAPWPCKRRGCGRAGEPNLPLQERRTVAGMLASQAISAQGEDPLIFGRLAWRPGEYTGGRVLQADADRLRRTGGTAPESLKRAHSSGVDVRPEMHA